MYYLLLYKGANLKNFNDLSLAEQEKALAQLRQNLFTISDDPNVRAQLFYGTGRHDAQFPFKFSTEISAAQSLNEGE